MASKDSSDDEKPKKFDMGNPGHTMSDDSSKSDSENIKRKKRPLRRFKKIIVEKRPRSTSSEKSYDGNKVLKGDISETSMSPLYQNQEADPKVQALIWNDLFGSNDPVESVFLRS